MNDRELLEAAAKAAGIEWLGWSPKKTDDASLSLAPLGRLWNPLVSDSDALRLAVKLGIHISPNSGGQSYANSTFETINDNGGDTYASTRRAIVRAAAALASQ